MQCDTAKRAHVPLSQYTVRELQERAVEFRRMAATARTEADAQGLTALAARYGALADRRGHEANDTNEVVASRPGGVTQSAVLRGSEQPMGEPSAEALVMASGAVGRHFVLAETRQHPVIQSAARRLAYLLMAYGLAPTKTKPVAAQQGNAQSAEGARDSARHVLVVDDVADVLVTVGAFLVKEGFSVHRAADGEEALRLIASDPQIDVVVTDFAMPGLSGVELIVQASQIRPHLKALVITGYPNADGLAELPPQTAILVKPFRRDTLIAGVKSLLGELPTVPNETAELVERDPIEQRRD